MKIRKKSIIKIILKITSEEGTIISLITLTIKGKGIQPILSESFNVTPSRINSSCSLKSNKKSVECNKEINIKIRIVIFNYQGIKKK